MTRRPVWADAVGVDRFGPFARLDLPGAPLRLRFVPPGAFWMGSPPEEEDREADEDLHRVVRTVGCWLGETPVTQAQWVAVMGDNPSRRTGCPDHPVACVTWTEARAFCGALSSRPGRPPARLPTEAEWECACRAGTAGPNWDPFRPLGDLAWYADNAGQRSHPVARKAPNPWGLFDMLGQVWEWCADAFAPYPLGEAVDPCPTEGSHRVVRGGGFTFPASAQRAAYRMPWPPDVRRRNLGLRLCCDP